MPIPPTAKAKGILGIKTMNLEKINEGVYKSIGVVDKHLILLNT